MIDVNFYMSLYAKGNMHLNEYVVAQFNWRWHYWLLRFSLTLRQCWHKSLVSLYLRCFPFNVIHNISYCFGLFQTAACLNSGVWSSLVIIHIREIARLTSLYSSFHVIRNFTETYVNRSCISEVISRWLRICDQRRRSERRWMRKSFQFEWRRSSGSKLNIYSCFTVDTNTGSTSVTGKIITLTRTAKQHGSYVCTAGKSRFSWGWRGDRILRHPTSLTHVQLMWVFSRLPADLVSYTDVAHGTSHPSRLCWQLVTLTATKLSALSYLI